MPNLSGLKSQILSTQDIGKITNAMQLVASSKLRKVGKKVTETQEYVSEVYDAFNEIIRQTDHSDFLKDNDKDFKKTLWVVVNSNLGLCGGYNANVNRMVLAGLKPDDAVYAIGSKAVSYYSARHINIKEQYLTVDIDFTSQQAGEIGRDVMSYFTSGEFDEIKLAYTKFINNVTFEPTTLRLFPIVKNEGVDEQQQSTSIAEFDPDPETILEKTVNLYLNTVLFGTIVESQVSEQASRRTAMENATNNGNDLIDTLHIKYNRERQAAITQEISEIVGGANALNDDN